jgi:hypothetical protein
MSLQIDMPKITWVLLADGWHECQGFGLDSYEFGAYHPDSDYASGWGFDCHHYGGQSDVCATGFVFYDVAADEAIAGTLTAILAVRGDGITDAPEPRDPHVAGRPAARP